MGTVAPDFSDDALQLDAFAMGRLPHQEVAELLDELLVISGQLPVGELVAPAAEAAGSFEQADQAGRETSVARVHGILRIADEVGQAELMLFGGKALLAAIAIRDPEVGPVTG